MYHKSVGRLVRGGCHSMVTQPIQACLLVSRAHDVAHGYVAWRTTSAPASGPYGTVWHQCLATQCVRGQQYMTPMPVQGGAGVPDIRGVQGCFIQVSNIPPFSLPQTSISVCSDSSSLQHVSNCWYGLMHACL
jgi:hypothetical protein